MIKGVTLEPPLQEQWDEWCLANGGESAAHLWQLCLDMFAAMHKAATDVRLRNSSPPQLFSKDDCDLERPPNISKIPAAYAVAFGALHRTCRRCSVLERIFVQAACKTMASLLKAKMIIHYFSFCDVRHLEFLSSVKHISEKGQPRLIKEALQPFQALVKAREDFLAFKSQHGAIIGTDVCRSNRTFLERCFAAIVTNAQGCRDKAIKAGFSSWLNMISLESRGKDLRGLRHEASWKNYTLCEHLIKPASYGFTRANLAEGAAPHARNHQKVAAQRRLETTGSLVDESDEAVEVRVRAVGKALQQRGVSAVTVLADELALIASLRFCGKYAKVVGAGGKNSFVDYADIEAGKVQVVPLSSLGKMAKCVGILPQSSDPIYIVLLRPGDADASAEATFNSKHQATLRRVLSVELGISVLSWFFDGISKEQEWLFRTLVEHMRAKEQDRPRVTAAGADMRHSVKALRNAMVFGGTACPHGGMLVANVTIFALLDVEIANVRVTDVFSDWRVEVLCRALPRFVEFRDVQAVPLNEVPGTLLGGFWGSGARGASKS